MTTSDRISWNPSHLKRIESSDADTWNRWRAAKPSVKPDLWDAKIERRDFAGWDLSGADLRLVNLAESDLRDANLRNARLRGARLRDADLRGADLRGADLSQAEMEQGGESGYYYIPTNLAGARLAGSNLAGANLEHADLSYCQLVDIDLSNACLDGATVFGTATWDVNLSNTQQRDLRITRPNQPYLTIDNLELAQFVYLLIENAKLRDVLDTLSIKTVLILGRFTDERMKYINLIREAVRRAGKIPMVFDFDKSTGKDLTGTIETLARLASCVVVDLSDPRSVPHELATIVPFLRTTPVVPLLDTRSSTYTMFPDLNSYPWVLKTWRYQSEMDLTNKLPNLLARAAERGAKLRHNIE